ncbi:RHS repeat-associated protein [Tahibacter aquaticus]|uniref:RHS repeat-associated protein n=1 Tax=Tahibacter aquaticus TaxID=520092 RepID=A0A4R6YPI3_9GAMM|nr:RHS repeat-associated core domain-containing protein [Tahibacter aquaticus]TDR39708.1 RHS repeat-associated protein [Tahibacter aquaticus]
MTGKPAARVEDKAGGGKVVSGSPNVKIGSEAEGQAQTNKLCEPAAGNPVNPLLGVKLLPPEEDFALAAPSTFAFARSYASSDRRIGVLGRGWTTPVDSVSLQLGETATELVDAQGRSIRFGPLSPGEERYSASEQIWLRRGGGAEPWQGRWADVPAALQADAQSAFLLSGEGWLRFTPQGAMWRLQDMATSFGYATRFVWGELSVVGEIHDSAGRCYALVYTRIPVDDEADAGLRLVGVVLANRQGPLPQDFDPARNDTDWLVRYDYDALGQLVAVRRRDGAVVRTFGWEAQRMSAHGQPGGMAVSYVWDAQGRVSEQHEAEGLSRYYDYHADHTEVRDSLGRSERYWFEGEGDARRWSAHERADGSITRFAYDGFGRRVRSTDALGQHTYLRRDAQGRVVGATVPDGRSWQSTLDARGLLVRREGPAGVITIARDARGRVIAANLLHGETVHYAYEDERWPDRVTAITDAEGAVRRQSWNALGLLASHTDCSGNVTQWRYDDEGRLVESIDALGRRSRQHYDGNGLRCAVTEADGAQYRLTHDALGRQVAVTAPDGACWRTQWDRFDRPVARIDALGREQRLEYDRAGRLVALQNENGAYCRFAYDIGDRLIEETGFDGRRQRYHYDAVDRLLAAEEGGQALHLRYDLAGRVIAREIHAVADAADWRFPPPGAPPLEVERFAWRRDGQLEAACNTQAEVRFDYDESGRRIGETQRHADGWRYTVRQHVDARGRAQSTHYGQAPAIHWQTYGPGHLQGLRVDALALEFERDPLHRETARHAWWQDEAQGQRRSAFHATRDYDAGGRLKRAREVPASGTATGRDYAYDAQGRLSGITDLHGRIAYAYDMAGRLVGSDHDGQKCEYRFDPAGNRLGQPTLQAAREDWAGTVQDNLPDAAFNLLGQREGPRLEPVACWPDNRIGSFDGLQYRYDAAGNLIERQSPDGGYLQLRYDALQRLVELQRQAADGSACTAHYAYDALGRRVSKRVMVAGREESTRYGWDGDRLVAEHTAQQQRTTVYEPGSFVPLLRLQQPLMATKEGEPAPAALGELLALIGAAAQDLPAELRPRLQAQQVAFFHTDHLGTPLRLSDSEGRSLWQARPGDWQAVREPTGESDQPLRFQGQWQDEESGLHYNRHRYYDPVLGRYLSQDPLGLSGNINSYRYSAGRPTYAVDPLGLKECVGTARVLKGNSRHIGKGGGFDTGPSNLERYGITNDAAVVIPNQFGLTKSAMRPYIDQISGVFADGTSFGRVRDVMDDKATRDSMGLSTTQFQQHLIDREKLKNGGKDLLVLELPGAAKDGGIQGVTLTIPDELECPCGTLPKP